MSFVAYCNYKTTSTPEFGQIPDSWSFRPLKHIVSTPITDGPHETPKFLDEGVLFISAEAVSKGEINFSKARFISRDEHRRYSQKYSPKRGDIFMVKSGATTGVVAIVETDRDFSIWSPLAAIRCKTIANPRFVFHAMRSRNFQESVTLNWSFGTQQNIGMAVLENLGIPFPPLAEQTQIARFLDHETAKIDTLIHEQKRLIELLKEKRQAVISHAVTKGLDSDAPMKDSGVEWLGEVPAHWDITPIKRVINLLEQGWSPQCENQPVESTEEFGVLKVGCVNRGVFKPTENKRLPQTLSAIPALTLKAGDLLISRANTRELVGSAAVSEEDHPNLMISDKLFRLRLNEKMAKPQFLSFFLGTPEARLEIEIAATGASSSMLNIGQGTILNMPFPCPPAREQEKITQEVARRTHDLSALMREASALMDLLNERRSALISAAVTGKIDVRNWQPPADESAYN